jgi:hypothetical protein
MLKFLSVVGLAVCCGGSMAHAQTDAATGVLRFYDAYTASFEATMQCAPPASPDLTNIIAAAQKAAFALHLQNPALSPAEIKASLDARREGVRKTVATAIAASGCDSDGIKQLRKNFTMLNAHPVSTDPAVNAPTAGSPDAAEGIFLFGRANYFRVLVAASNCSQFDAAKFAQLAQRFEQARLGLVKKYGPQFFPVDKPINPPPQGRPCDSGMLLGYENHISEMEQNLKH